MSAVRDHGCGKVGSSPPVNHEYLLPVYEISLAVLVASHTLSQSGALMGELAAVLLSTCSRCRAPTPYSCEGLPSMTYVDQYCPDCWRFFQSSLNLAPLAFVRRAVSRCGLSIREASALAKADRRVALAAVTADSRALEFVDHWLRGDRDIVLAAVRRHGSALAHAFPHLCRDRDVVLAAVTTCGRALSSRNQLRDKEIVLAAVKQDGSAMWLADESVRRDLEIVRAAKRHQRQLPRGLLF